MFCYPMLWILSWIVAIVGLYRSFLHLEFEVFDYIYLFMGPRFQHITFGLVKNKHKFSYSSIDNWNRSTTWKSIQIYPLKY